MPTIRPASSQDVILLASFAARAFTDTYRELSDAQEQEVHAQARRRGAQTLWLGVYDRNLRAVQFYERLGFARVGDQEFLFGGQIYIDPVYTAAVEGERP